MDKEQLTRHLLATFQEELADHVRTLNDGLLALENDPQSPARAERLKEIFRAAHSLKGAAHAVNLRPIELLCHRLEDVLRGVQDGAVPLDPELFDTLYRAADALEQSRTRVANGEAPALAVDEVVSRLARFSERRAGAEALAAAAAEIASRDTSASQVAVAELAPSASAETLLRISSAKLETLLARTGELLVRERQLERVEDGLAAASESVGRVWRNWQRLRRELRALSNGPSGLLEPALGAVESALRTAGTELDRAAAAFQGDRRAIGRTIRLVDDAVREARLVPFSEACRGLARAVRDLAKDTGKEVEVSVEGGSTEIDRSLLERLRDPLLSLVRNSVDHGIEAPERRRALGKPAKGNIRIAAGLRGTGIEVTVEDDGGGVDLAAVREAARRRGLPEPGDDQECFRLLFEPGFSVKRDVTELSGRGVGLDIVKNRVEEMHGSVTLASGRDRGARVTLLLPLTLTTIRAVVVGERSETFAIATTAIDRLVRLPLAQVRSAGGREVIPDGNGAPIPIVPLSRALGLADRPEHGNRNLLAVVVREPARAAFSVDALVAEREILVKDLGRRIRSIPAVAGATILENGRVIPILNPAELVRAAHQTRGELSFAPLARPTVRKRILLADDSVTTRSLERAILETAGYEVVTVVDGQEAWRVLRERGADLVISDVDMPRMDGFSLCETVRASKRFGQLPFILVTSLESASDKARGAEAGADAYIVKSSFDRRHLLDTIAALLGAKP